MIYWKIINIINFNNFLTNIYSRTMLINIFQKKKLVINIETE